MGYNQKIIHVELNEPYQGKKHWYFGSISAVFQELPTEVVGVTLESLWSHWNNDEYRNKLCTIIKSSVTRKKTDRGRYGRTK